MNQTPTTMYSAMESAPRRLPFLAATAVVFSTLASLLYAVDFVPEQHVSASPATEASSSLVAVEDSTTLAARGERATVVNAVPEDNVPVRIVIPSIGVNAPIATPASTDISVLDRALLSGAVQYPGSAEAGERGTMLVFGHSSYLPVVKNKAFQTFNELGKLAKGARIEVYSGTKVFEYEVTDVSLMRAEDTVIRFDGEEPLLTLATCNTFGSKEERWVAQARLTHIRTL